MQNQAQNEASTPDNHLGCRPALLDIDLEPYSGWGTLPAAILAGGLIGLLISAVVILVRVSPLGQKLAAISPFAFSMVVLLTAIIFILVVQLRRGRWAERRIRSQLEGRQGPTIANEITALLDEMLRRRFLDQGGLRVRHSVQGSAIPVLRGLTRGLARSDCREVTVRACTSQFAIPIQPIAVPIEPLPLDESVPFIAQLGDEDRNDFERPKNPAFAVADHGPTPDESAYRRRFKRNLTLLGGRWVFVLFLLGWSTIVIGALLAWRITWHLVVGTVLLGCFAFAPGGRGAWRVSQQWLIVPGGLIARRANWRGGWNVHLFDRRASVLTAYRHTRNQWYICVADGDKDQETVVTPTESLALLRAWLSPLEPPPIERLRELAGE